MLFTQFFKSDFIINVPKSGVSYFPLRRSFGIRKIKRQTKENTLLFENTLKATLRLNKQSLFIRLLWITVVISSLKHDRTIHCNTG